MFYSGYRTKNQWKSGSDRLRLHRSEDIKATHTDLFNHLDQAISDGFQAMNRSLIDLQIQIQVKLRYIKTRQESMLDCDVPTEDVLSEFYSNIKNIKRTMEAFTKHANNLSHIKLTLSRAAAFVSPEGHVSQLITQAEPDVDNYNHKNNYLTTLDTFSSPSHEQPTYPRQYQQHQSNDLFSSYPSLYPTIPSSGQRVENATCFVFYLPPSITNQRLKEIFAPYGTVINVYVAKDKVNNPRGFGFVDFSSPTEALAAVHALDKFPVEDKFLSVSIKV